MTLQLRLVFTGIPSEGTKGLSAASIVRLKKSREETVHSFITDISVQDAIPLARGCINVPAMGGEYSYDVSNGIHIGIKLKPPGQTANDAAYCKKYGDYTMKKQTKPQELIHPQNKITPPRTRLNKNSRLKYLFKTSIRHSAIHQRLPWKWNTLFLPGLTANLFLTARPNSKANGIRSLYTKKVGRGRSLCLLTPILVILAVISSCSDDTASKSSQSEITELTVTINSIDYPISFDANNTAAVTIPYVSTLPTEITVTRAAISAKATGLAAGNTLKISSGKADITVTAEDGSSTAYTLNVKMEAPLLAAVQARSEITYHSEDALKPDNYRTSILPFSIKTRSAGAEGEYHLAVREAGNPVPTATDIRDSSAVILRSLSTAPINVFLSFHMDTDLFDSATAWTDNSDTSILNYGMVDTALLQPETEYKLYAVAASGSDTVYTLLTHSTDAEPELSLVTDISSDYDMFYSVPIEHTYTVRKGEPFLLLVGVVNTIYATSFKNSNYEIQGQPKDLTTILQSGVVFPAIANDDRSLFFAARIESNIGKYVMISKNSHANTASAGGGVNFSIHFSHTNILNSKGEYLFIWE